MEWWQMLVKTENIAPSEVWKMSITDALYLVDFKPPKDLSGMTNMSRKLNGAPDEYLV